MKKMLIAGNWKMNTNVFESEKLAEYIIGYLENNQGNNSKVLICPPFTSLSKLSELINGTDLALGAQNCHFEEKGAFTGEISLKMLAQCSVSYVIIGHSERRAYFAESDEMINMKLLAALNADITPILCIGETIEQRKEGKTFDILSAQLSKNLVGVSSDMIDKIVIAYEPVWAIGTGLSASIEQVAEAHDWLRNYLTQKFGAAANEVILLYGGSLNENNAEEILSAENVNGGLIGGASLKGETFAKIIETAAKFAV